ncbi:putative DNA repair exonuclease [Pseudomonas phage UAntarctica]|nr:putative DNA repair exonuclease [Pseudomonas phage UAntarctica]
MTHLTIFTDPHLGTSRAAHTTRDSSKRLQDELFFQAMAIVSTGDHPKVCVGDLFDKSFNPEHIIAQGFNVASKCSWTLAGNHDETNREGTLPSLRLLMEAGVPICAVPNLTDPYFEARESVYLVPHHASQATFEVAMRNAAAHAAANRDGLASYLFLHCNYNFDLATEDNTLNLSEQLAKELISAFDYIFIGHEHNSSTHLGGQVVVLGNTHPTSFHDVGDKFIYHLELETAELTKELIWSKKDSYREIKLGGEIPDLKGVQFVDVTGTEAVANAMEVSDFVQEVWKAGNYQACGAPGDTQASGELQNCNDLLAVRNKVAVKDSLADADTEIGEVQVVDLRTRIQADLEGSDLAPLFNELVQKVTA